MSTPTYATLTRTERQLEQGNSVYLFINHDSITGVQSQDKRKIAAHAQRNSKRTLSRLIRNRKSIVSSTHNLVGWKLKDDIDLFDTPPELSRNSSSSTWSSRTGSPDTDESEHRCSTLGILKLNKTKSDHVDEDDSTCTIYTEDAALIPAVDFLSGSALPMDNSKHTVLIYFSKAWLPSDEKMPKDCHIWGFAPVNKDDRALSSQIISNALQSSDQLHFYALLAVATSRMRWLSMSNSHSPVAPEKFVIWSIRALRRFLDSGNRPDSSVLMDLAFLTLAEFFAGSVRSGIYWQLIKDFVIACGGFRKLSPFVSHTLIATDWKISAAFVKPLVFDFEAYPALLGLDEDKDVNAAIEEAVKCLDPRVMIRVRNSMTLAEVINAINRLHTSKSAEICDYITGYQRKQYRYCAQCLRLRNEQSMDVETPEKVSGADLLDQRTKAIGFRLWLWQIALTFVDPTTLYAKLSHAAAARFANDCAQMLDFLSRANSLLQGTHWMLDPKTLLWKLVLALLVTERSETRANAVAALRKVATELHVTSAADLEEALAVSLPLDRLNGYDLTDIMKTINDKKDPESAGQSTQALQEKKPANPHRLQFSEAEHAALMNLGSKRRPH